MRRSTLAIPALALLAAAASACAPPEGDVTEGPEEVVLGPADGHDLPGIDLERVRVGDLAPDFTLTSLAGPPVRLSQFRGEKNVVLVFYRGHW